MNDFEFNEQQKNAINEAVLWFSGWQDRKHRKQVFFLAGYAGTGKTSVARTISELCGGQSKVVFIAPTGKAASRLRQKGCKYAKTMHQLIYNVRGENEDGEPIFIGKGAMEESNVSLIILDEGVMVGHWDNQQLLSFGIPILVLGDTGQVQPVKDSPAYHEGNFDVQLTQIMRQAESSNIIRASMFVRQGKRLPIREYDDVRVREGLITKEDIWAHIDEDSVMLCSFNNTRTWLNGKVRRMMNYNGDIPQIGEKVVCLFNQHAYGFMNGEQGIVLGYSELGDDADENKDEGPMMMVHLRSLTDGTNLKVKFNPLSFSRDAEVKLAAQKSVGGFDYGYALTVHKSQGSEWKRVLVVEEIMRGNNYAKMMYTAVTRAQQCLTVYRDFK